MRVMVLIKANKDSEAGVMPSEQLMREMGNYNEELVKAGVMLAGEGLHPSFGCGKCGRWKRRSNGSSGVRTRWARRPTLSFGRCSKRRISAPSSRPNSGNKRTVSAPRSKSKSRDPVDA